MDEGQDLYGKKRIWSDAGINARGRKRQLNIIYRNTKEIADLANRFRYGSAEPGQGASSPQHALFPDPRISRGPAPALVHHRSWKELIEAVALKIRTLVDHGDFPFSEIAILYTRKKAGPEGEASVPEMAQTALDRQGIMYKWLSEDYRAKRQHDITSNSVTISTIHSAKGLDFACVFLVGLDALVLSERWGDDQIKSLAYVAMTRARYHLEIHYCLQTPLIEQVQQCLPK